MGYSTNDRHVEAFLFNDTGKWKYTVCLDYSNSDYNDFDLWSAAIFALEDATKKCISGVTLTRIPKDWILFVPNPYNINSHPISVKGA